MAMQNRESSGGGRKSAYPVGSWDWIQEQSKLMEQRKFQEMLEKQKKAAQAQPSQHTGYVEPEEISLPTRESGTRNPVGDLSKTSIPSFSAPIDLVQEGQALANQADTINKSGESSHVQRNQLGQILAQWQRLGGDYTDHIKAGDYDILLINGKYHAMKDGNEVIFDTPGDLLNHVYGKRIFNIPPTFPDGSRNWGLRDEIERELNQQSQDPLRYRESVRPSKNDLVSRPTNTYTTMNLGIGNRGNNLAPQPGPRPDYTPTPTDELRYELGTLRDNQLGVVTKVKSIVSSDKAIDRILAYAETIDSVSTELGVPKEMIQAILYREQVCLGLDDVLADFYVNNIDPIVGRKNDSSTGLGQIFAKTAITAENEVLGNYNLDPSNDDDVATMWTKLHDDDKTSIYYVGLVLLMEAQRQGVDLSTADSTQITNVLAAYNGGQKKYTSDDAQRYGTQTKQYYDLFAQYDSQKY